MIPTENGYYVHIVYGDNLNITPPQKEKSRVFHSFKLAANWLEKVLDSGRWADEEAKDE